MRAPFQKVAGPKLAVAAVALITVAPAVHAQDIRWLTLRQWNAYGETDFEMEQDSETSGSSRFTSDRVYLAPTLGLNVAGSIYHPNLLSFDLKGQGGYIEQDLTSRLGGQEVKTRETSFLQNYDVALNFLQNRPYAFTFTADKTHAFQELDMFNQVTVDAQSYGGNLGYTAGPVPFNVTLQHSDTDQTGAFYNSTFHQDNLQLSAQNNRNSGTTTLAVTAGQYDQEITGGFGEKQTYGTATLTDTEKFGKNDRAVLSSSAMVTEANSSGGSERNLTDQESLTVRHSPTLESFYDYNFNNAAYSGAEATTHNAMIGMRHQFYESLSSEVDVHAATAHASDAGASSVDIYGIANSENYTKRLSTWGVLSLGNSARYDLEHQDNSGQITPVFNESHTLSDGIPAFLSQPLVISVSKVTDATGAHIYIPGIDYIVTHFGALVVVERVPTSINLPNNSTVLVDYTVQSQPSGSITTLSDQITFRLDLWKGLLALYSTLGWVENYSKEPFVLENYFNTQSGVDFRWRWLRLGAAYETEDSNLIGYSAYSLYQSAIFQPTSRETLSFDARERWADYTSQNLSVTDYSLTSRLSEHFTPKLEFSVEGGVLSETGGLLDQTLFTAGAQARYALGKLSFALNYQFNHEVTPGSLVLRNFASFTARRDF